MSRGMPSMTALLGLLAIAGYQNRDKLAEMLGHAAGTCFQARKRRTAASAGRSARRFEQHAERKTMIRPTVVALALCVVSSAQSMPYVPLQQPNNSVIPVRQGCGLGRQLVDGICVRNSAVRAAVRKCSSRKMRMVNGRCEPRARPAAAPAAAQPTAAPAAAPPTTQQPAATPATPR